MPLELPNLDTLTYNGLVEEARKAIPRLDPNWTNHNPTDPGMVLIELFAWLTEMLSYRVDQVTDDSLRAFLSLLNGPERQAPTASDTLEQAKAQTIAALHRCDRAITCADWERLVLKEWPKTKLDEALAPVFVESKDTIAQALGAIDGTNPSTMSIEQFQKLPEANVDPTKLALSVRSFFKRHFNTSSEEISAQEMINALHTEIKRVYCVEERNLAYLGPGVKAPGHVSLIVLAGNEPLYEQRDALCALLWAYLDKRRLLTTHHHVVGPTYVEINITAELFLQRDAVEESVKGNATTRVKNFFCPVSSNDNPMEWPFGRNVYISEIYQLLDDVTGVDFVENVVVEPAKPGGQRKLMNNKYEIIGIAVEPHELVQVEFTPKLRRLSESEDESKDLL